MSGRDGDVNDDPLPFCARGGDFRELFEDWVPLEAVESPLRDSLAFFRLKSPILKKSKGRDTGCQCDQGMERSSILFPFLGLFAGFL